MITAGRKATSLTTLNAVSATLAAADITPAEREMIKSHLQSAKNHVGAPPGEAPLSPPPVYHGGGGKKPRR